MPDIEYQIPPVITHSRRSSMDNLDGDYLGWQIRGWMVDQIHKEFGVTGINVKVGVGDTGVSKSHTKEGGDLENIVSAKSFIPGENEWDVNGHGSHCSSQIHAVKNDSGILGYSPDAQGYHAKVLSNGGSGGDSGIANGINWLASQGCKVISLSLGSPHKSSVIINAIRDADEQGIITVMASGNDGKSNDVDYPAAASSGLIGVAIDSKHNLASFSDRGPQISHRGVSGAGVRVYACLGKGYGLMSGTSMATPSVAGQFTLAIDAEIKYLGKQVTKGFKSAISLVKEYPVDLGSPGNDSGYGLGAFDVYSYIKKLHESSNDPPNEKNEWSDVGSFEHENNVYRIQKKDQL
jgi:subtilisin family serine protease